MPEAEFKPISYSAPPITEAVIGISFASPIDQKKIDTVNTRFKINYPNHQLVSNYGVAVNIPMGNGNQPTTNINKENGYRHSSLDMTQLLVLWQSSFIVSQLAPYKGWEHFFSRFVSDWNIWKKTIGFQTIQRIGVRFINRIDIPVKDSSVSHEEFLNVYPKLPANLDPIDAYAVQASMRFPDIDCVLRINSAAVPSPILDHIAFVIDIDISREVNPPQNDEEIFDILNAIRIKKNEVFESCVSDRARELFK